ncbi:transposon Ty3-I Gag-Pol polyprotein [Trichonephila clavipes]|nr:transposon Ty3-I Gag-Pol polyprotein [Trichonephila clavipes]
MDFPGCEDSECKLLAFKKDIFISVALFTLNRGYQKIGSSTGSLQQKMSLKVLCAVIAEPFHSNSIAVISEASFPFDEFAERKQSIDFSQMIVSDLNYDQELRLTAVLQEYSEVP